MPMNTMLEMKRPPSRGTNAPSGGAAPGQSPSRSRATMSCATISRRGQVAHEALRAGVAEGAGERAADLARDAERAAIDLGDVDALDLRALVERARRRHADQPLAGAVLRDLLGDDLRAGRACRRRPAPRAGPCRRSVIVVEVAGAAKVDPVPELRRRASSARARARRWRRAFLSIHPASGRPATACRGPRRLALDVRRSSRPPRFAQPRTPHDDYGLRCRATPTP